MGSNTCKFLWKKIDHGKCFKSLLLRLASIFSPGSPPSHLIAVPKSTWHFWLVLTLLFYEIIHSVWSIRSCFQDSVSTLGPELKSVSDSTIVLSSYPSTIFSPTKLRGCLSFSLTPLTLSGWIPGCWSWTQAKWDCSFHFPDRLLVQDDQKT